MTDERTADLRDLPDGDEPDRAEGAMDVVEGEIGSARLREPSQVEEENGDPDLAAIVDGQDT